MVERMTVQATVRATAAHERRRGMVGDASRTRGGTAGAIGTVAITYPSRGPECLMKGSNE
jgi:hypothetical protein